MTGAASEDKDQQYIRSDRIGWSAAAEKKASNSTNDDDESDDDDDDDEVKWQWKWAFNTSLELDKNSTSDLSILKASDLQSFILSAFSIELNKKYIASKTKPATPNTSEVGRIDVLRARAMFPFSKGADYEMGLKTDHELLIIKLTANDNPSVSRLKEDGSEATGGIKGQKERWSSIDDDLDEKVTRLKKKIATIQQNTIPEIHFDPPIESFVDEIVQFLGFNKSYGEGWRTALKVAVNGCFDKGLNQTLVKFKLRDIGLVPGNYLDFK